MFSRSRKSVARALIRSVCAGKTRQVLDLLTDDIVFIDSKSVRISGREEFAQLLESISELDLCLEIEDDLLALQGDEVLMSGEQTSSDPLFTARIQWRIQFRGKKVCEIQTYRGAGAPSIVLMAEEIQRGANIPPKTPPPHYANG